MIARLLTAFLIGMWTLTTSSQANTFPGRPECPWSNLNNNWKDFMSGRYGGLYPAFSIRFDKARSSIGNITANRCYTVTYIRGVWQVSGYYLTKKENIVGGAVFNPDEYKMNIWGIPFTFNEAGEVFHPELGHVGSLKCLIGRDC
jgi:hypothetical protein